MLNRRTFLGSMAMAVGAPAIHSRTLLAAEGNGDWTITADAAAAKIKPYIRCGDETITRFAAQVYQQCVLGKIRQPSPY